MIEEKLTGAEVRRQRERLDIRADIFYPHYVGVSSGTGSRFELGLGKLQYETYLKVEDTLACMTKAQQRQPEVPINFNKYRQGRKLLREIKREGPPEQIEQIFAALFIATFCGHARMSPAEFCACAQLSSRVIDAEIVSMVAQRWIRAWAGAIAAILASRNETFETYAQRFQTRQAALEKIAADAFASLLIEVGRQQMLACVNAMMLTGEMKAAPLDLDVN